jgi:hypothetical protein
VADVLEVMRIPDSTEPAVRTFVKAQLPTLSDAQFGAVSAT